MSPPCRVIAGDAEDGAATAIAVVVVAVVAAAAGSGCARQVPEPSCFDGAKNANEFGQDCGLKAGCSPCDFELIELAQVRFVSTGVPIEAAGVLPATRGTSAVLGYSSIAPVMYLCACVRVRVCHGFPLSQGSDKRNYLDLLMIILIVVGFFSLVAGGTVYLWKRVKALERYKVNWDDVKAAPVHPQRYVTPRYASKYARRLGAITRSVPRTAMVSPSNVDVVDQRGRIVTANGAVSRANPVHRTVNLDDDLMGYVDKEALPLATHADHGHDDDVGVGVGVGAAWGSASLDVEQGGGGAVPRRVAVSSDSGSEQPTPRSSARSSTKDLGSRNASSLLALQRPVLVGDVGDGDGSSLAGEVRNPLAGTGAGVRSRGSGAQGSARGSESTPGDSEGRGSVHGSPRQSSVGTPRPRSGRLTGRSPRTQPVELEAATGIADGAPAAAVVLEAEGAVHRTPQPGVESDALADGGVSVATKDTPSTGAGDSDVRRSRQLLPPLRRVPGEAADSKGN